MPRSQWKQRVLINLILATALFGCESEERRNIFTSQACLDRVSVPSDLREGTENEVNSKLASLRSEINECIMPITDLTTKDAFVIKCAAGFLSGGIDSSAIVDTYSTIDQEGDQNAVAPDILERLSFGPSVEDRSLSQQTLSDCSNAGSDTLVALSGLSDIATQFENVAGDGQIGNLIDNYEEDDLSVEEKVDLANTILDSREELCNPESGVLRDEELCSDLNEAVADNGGDDGLSEAEKEELINDFIGLLGE